MNSRIRETQRRVTAQRRRRPGAGRLLTITFDGVDPIEADPQDPPAEIHLEATGSEGETAIWLDDFFWLSMLQPWSQHQVFIRFLPTQDCLLHPVVQHQLNMLRRVAPAWHLTCECYLSDLADEGFLTDAALSGWHEIHVLNAVRPDAKRTVKMPTIRAALARIRQVQEANKRTSPIVVCEQDHRPADVDAPLRMPDVQPARRAV